MTCLGRILVLIFALVGLLPSAALAANPCPPSERIAIIDRVKVKGSTLNVETLSRAYADQIGKPDTITSRRAVAKEIAAAYELSDIALFDVTPGPPKECGVVEIIITEGRVGRTAIRGKLDALTKSLIDRYLAKLVVERPLHISTLQRYVSLIREIGGVRSQVEFEPTDERGVVQILVTALQSRFKIGLSIDNRSAPVIGEVQAQLSGSFYSLLKGGDALDTAVATTQYPGRLVSILGSYSAPLGANGTRISLSVAQSRSNLTEYHYSSFVNYWDVKIFRPIISSYRKNGYIGIDLKRTKSRLKFYEFDLIRGNGWSIGPNAGYGIVSGRGEFFASITIALGSARRSSDLVYLYPASKTRRITLQASANRTLSSKFTLRLKSVAQIGTRNLPATEQLSFGGSEFGRAFASGSFAGDSGFVGMAELAVRLGRPINSAENQSDIYTFFDAGRLSYHDPLSSNLDSQNLISSGIGIRFARSSRIALSLEAAVGEAHVFAERKIYQRLSIGIQSRLF